LAGGDYRGVVGVAPVGFVEAQGGPVTPDELRTWLQSMIVTTTRLRGHAETFMSAHAQVPKHYFDDAITATSLGGRRAAFIEAWEALTGLNYEQWNEDGAIEQGG
jgi:hypothetical protein